MVQKISRQSGYFLDGPESFWIAWKMIYAHFFCPNTINAHFFVAKMIWAHFFVAKTIYAHFCVAKTIYSLLLLRKQFTHFIRKVFARWKLPSGKFRLFGPLGKSPEKLPPQHCWALALVEDWGGEEGGEGRGGGGAGGRSPNLEGLVEFCCARILNCIEQNKNAKNGENERTRRRGWTGLQYGNISTWIQMGTIQRYKEEDHFHIKLELMWI